MIDDVLNRTAYRNSAGEYKLLSGLNRLKLNAFMPLVGINSVLPGLNQFKPAKPPAGTHQFKLLEDRNPSKAVFSYPV